MASLRYQSSRVKHNSPIEEMCDFVQILGYAYQIWLLLVVHMILPVWLR